jgi:hypothetical protein
VLSILKTQEKCIGWICDTINMSICSINYLDFKCRTANPSMNTYIGRKGPSSGGGGFLANPYLGSNPARPRGDAAFEKKCPHFFYWEGKPHPNNKSYLKR